MLASLRSVLLPVVVGATLGYAGHARAQQTAAAPAPTGPVVNDVAPDFALAGATRYGLLKNPVRLSDFRGRTVVLAFFYQARTKG
jgi:hypothetical protein